VIALTLLRATTFIDPSQESEERISTQLTAEKARIAALEQAAGALESVVAKSKTDKDQVLMDSSRELVRVCMYECVRLEAVHVCECVR